MTRGVLSALLEAGLRPGEDVCIITIENRGSTVLGPFASNITRIVIDPAAVVHAALDMLEQLMEGRTPPRNPVLIPPMDVIRSPFHFKLSGNRSATQNPQQKPFA